MAVSVSVPTERVFAGMVRVEAPLDTLTAEEVYPPPVSVTVPVGAARPPEPATVTVTDRLCATVIDAAAGVTVTVAAAPPVAVPQ